MPPVVKKDLRNKKLTFMGKGDKLGPMSDQRAHVAGSVAAARKPRAPLYTPAERVRRDSTYWTFIQGLLAPIQFIVFLASLGLVLRYLWTGEGLQIANHSVIAKTIMLYTIMITGCIWEKVVFGRYLFAPAFFWEDVFSMLVLALHTSYLFAMYTGRLSGVELMYLALAAYATYVINAGQFILKLRAARLDHEAQLREQAAASGVMMGRAVA
jgi:3-vinyl bacteriochlorophyllide hydratase